MKGIRESKKSKRKQKAAYMSLFTIGVLVILSLLAINPVSGSDESTPRGKIPLEKQKTPQIKKPPLPSQVFDLKTDPTKVLALPSIDVGRLL